MRVGVDEAGQEQAIARVDDLGIGGGGEPGRADRANGVALEEDVPGLPAVRRKAQDAAAANDLEGARLRYRHQDPSSLGPYDSTS